eukprot:COSAG01_NODE_11012_length_2027_cov_1.981328_1_plen_371_part_00
MYDVKKINFCHTYGAYGLLYIGRLVIRSLALAIRHSSFAILCTTMYVINRVPAAAASHAAARQPPPAAAARRHMSASSSSKQQYRVLLTGAAGLVGGICRSGWARAREPFSLVRCADIRPVTDLRANEEFQHCDITQLGELVRACDGCDTVVHLAAYPGAGLGYEEGDSLGEVLLQLNIVGAFHAFEAARICRCQRLVFCSSIGAVDGYRMQGRENTAWDVPAQPSTMYGASKCWGEALGSVYAITHGLSVICVRLCWPKFSQHSGPELDERVPVCPDPTHTVPSKGGSSGWGSLLESGMSGMSPRDCASLFAACIKADVERLAQAQPTNPRGYAIVNGISNHTRPWLDTSAATRALGWEPQDGTAMPRL